MRRLSASDVASAAALLLGLIVVTVGSSASWGVQTPHTLSLEAVRARPQHAAFVGFSLPAGSTAPTRQRIRCTRRLSASMLQQQQQQQQQQLMAVRRPFVGGNWKCNANVSGADAILQMLNDSPPDVDDIEVVVAPPSLHAGSVLRGLQRPFAVGLQDCSVANDYGAFTGELSPQMIKDFGIQTVIVGHSERRAGFGGQPGESDEVVAAKARNAVSQGLQVIACIGESLEARQHGRTIEVLGKQLKALAAHLSPADWRNIVLAYEPIWAIGTGKTATPQLAQETHRDIRSWLLANVSAEVADMTRIIYGGSVKGSNAKDLFSGKDVDGFLVGGACLTSDFHAILKGANALKS